MGMFSDDPVMDASLYDLFSSGGGGSSGGGNSDGGGCGGCLLIFIVLLLLAWGMKCCRDVQDAKEHEIWLRNEQRYSDSVMNAWDEYERLYEYERSIRRDSFDRPAMNEDYPSASSSHSSSPSRHPKGGYYYDGYEYGEYDSEGYDRNGYDRDGYDRDGYDEEGYDSEGIDDEGYDEYGNYADEE